MSLAETWTCEACGDERPDAQVATARAERRANGQMLYARSVRYCLDRAACGASAFVLAAGGLMSFGRAWRRG
jgi:hypothetical protein